MAWLAQDWLTEAHPQAATVPADSSHTMSNEGAWGRSWRNTVFSAGRAPGSAIGARSIEIKVVVGLIFRRQKRKYDQRVDLQNGFRQHAQP